LDGHGKGPAWLQDSHIAKLVAQAILIGEVERHFYDLSAWVVMPNHVHLLILPQVPVAQLMRWLKGSTARAANRVLGRTGQPFWQDESWDHYLRHSDQINRTIRYIEGNPVSAGLVGSPERWPWSSAGWQAELNNSFHELKVKVVEYPHLELRYRKGYVDQSAPPEDENLRRAALADAVFSPMDANGMGLRAQVNATSAGLDVTLRVDPHSILLAPQGDRWDAKLDLLFVEKDGHGQQLSGVDDTVALALHRQSYDKVERKDCSTTAWCPSQHAPPNCAWWHAMRRPARSAVCRFR